MPATKKKKAPAAKKSVPTEFDLVCGSSASAIANFFLEKGKEKVTPMKLLKLVFIGYGWCLAVLNRKLFSEDVQAWKFGPVIPSLYHEFKHFGGHPIDTLSTCFDPFESTEAEEPRLSSEHNDVLVVLEIVWKLYGDKTASQLMRLTHENGTPWQKNYKEDQFHTRIPSKDIFSYYKQEIEELFDVGE